MIDEQNFIIKSQSVAKTDYGVEMELDSKVRDLANLDTDTIIADLEFLSQTHPEFLKKPSDVFRLIREIKNNPTHFYNNNRLDMHLIGKFLQDGSFAEMGVVANNGKVGHILKANDGQKRARNLNSRNNEGSLVGIVNSDTPTQKGGMDELVNKSLLANPVSEIIPQNSNKSQVSTKNSHNQAQEPKQPRADEILFNGYKEIRKEQESNITQTTQKPSVDGDIDINTSPRGPKR